MSETEVIDTAEELKDLAPCYGTWDEDYNDCVKVCELRERCKSHTENAAKPRPPAPEPKVEEIEDIPELEPKEYLVECLKGRHDVMVKDTEKGFMVAARKDGKMAVKVMIVPSGKVLIDVIETGAKVQLPELESCRQVLNIAKALLLA